MDIKDIKVGDTLKRISGYYDRTMVGDCVEVGSIGRVGFFPRGRQALHDPSNYVKVEESLTVEEAIKFLKSKGTVSFKPHFTPIMVKLNRNHKAGVFCDMIQVGCQSFSFEAVDELAAAVAQVRKYNADN